MKLTVTRSMFLDAMRKYYTIEACNALYDYLLEWEESTGGEIELDPIGIHCEWVEYKSFKEFREDNNEKIKNIKELKEKTIVIEFNGGLLVNRDY